MNSLESLSHDLFSRDTHELSVLPLDESPNSLESPDSESPSSIFNSGAYNMERVEDFRLRIARCEEDN